MPDLLISELRDKIKEEVQAGDKGGEPGQWFVLCPTDLNRATADTLPAGVLEKV